MEAQNQTITFIEKREHLRFYVYYPADVYAKGRAFTANVMDISEDGFGISSSHCFMPGEVIRVLIKIHPELPEANLLVCAKVIWMKWSDFLKLHIGGMTITDITVDDVMILKKHLTGLTRRVSDHSADMISEGKS